MKLDELKNGCGLQDFTVSLCKDTIAPYHEKVEELWKQSESIHEFKALVLTEPCLENTQLYAVMSRKEDAYAHSERIIKMFDKYASKMAFVGSEVGSVLVKDIISGASINVPNGYGDGDFSVAVFENRDDFNSNMMDFTGISLNGEFCIMDYDCDNDSNSVVAELNGNYLVYSFNGYVAFVKM